MTKEPEGNLVKIIRCRWERVNRRKEKAAGKEKNSKKEIKKN